MENKNSVILDKVSKYNNLEDVKGNDLLLLEQPKESLAILESINLTHHIHKVRNKVNEENAVKQQKLLFGKNVYLGSDIKKLCTMYDLKCAKAEYYLGEVGPELAQKITEFVKEHEYESEGRVRQEGLDDDGKKVYKTVTTTKSKIMTTSRNFFILAPSENFTDANSKTLNATLFYREHDNSNDVSEKDTLIEIFSWGNNYSNGRMINPLIKIKSHHKDGGSDNDDLTLASFFYIVMTTLLFITIIGTIYNQNNGILVFNIIGFSLLSLSLLFNKHNLTHFSRWNRNNY